MTQPAPETIRTPKTRIACDGTGDGLADAALGHPRVWLEIDTDEGFADCGYCDRRFVLQGGPGERGLHEVDIGDLPEADGAGPA